MFQMIEDMINREKKDKGDINNDLVGNLLSDDAQNENLSAMQLMNEGIMHAFDGHFDQAINSFR